jgi:hypothetical protein
MTAKHEHNVTLNITNCQSGRKGMFIFHPCSFVKSHGSAYPKFVFCLQGR